MSEIDLSPFSDPKGPRKYLRGPFSDDTHTYATNGHILVRVARRADVDENEMTGRTKRVTDLIDKCPNEFVSLAQYTLPDFDMTPRTKMRYCDECGGSGHEHDCPHCTCDCEACDGAGKYEETVTPKASVEVLGSNFALNYIKTIWALPNLTVAISGDALVFRFDGGDGVLMGLNSPYDEHLGSLQLKEAVQ